MLKRVGDLWTISGQNQANQSVYMFLLNLLVDQWLNHSHWVVPRLYPRILTQLCPRTLSRLCPRPFELFAAPPYHSDILSKSLIGDLGLHMLHILHGPDDTGAVRRYTV